MIKFFRTIKLSAIANGKLKQYVIYALGEVLLIVVGILLALQINNWNENRKTEFTNRKMLEQIKEEILINSFVLDRDKDYRDTIFSIYQGFTELLSQENLPSHKLELEQFLAPLFRSTVYNFSQNSVTSYLNNNVNDNSLLTRSLLELNSTMNDLELISKRGFDLKFENFYNGLGNDVDLSNFKIRGFDTLKTLNFKNKMVLISYVEEEISTRFDQTSIKQQQVDSLITDYLKD